MITMHRNPAATQPLPSARLIWGLWAFMALALAIPMRATSDESNPSSATPGSPPVAIEGATQTVLADGRTLILGGRDASAEARVYDPVTGATTPLASGLQFARRLHAASRLADGTVLVTGGLDAQGYVIREAERFDPATLRFESIGDPGSIPRAGHSTQVLLDGKVIVTGGRGRPSEAITQAEVLDLRGNTVRELGRQEALNRIGGEILRLPDGRLLINGGRTVEGKPSASGVVFDPLTDRLTSLSGEDTAKLLVGAAAFPTELTVRESLPGSRALRVDPSGVLAVRFSRPVNPVSVSAATVGVIGASGPVAARVSLSEDGLVAFVVPNQPLKPGANYLLVARGLNASDTTPLTPVATIPFQTEAVGAPGSSSSGRSSAQGTTPGATAAVSPTAAPPGASVLPQAQTLAVAAIPTDSDEAFAPGARNLGGHWFSDQPLPRDLYRRVLDSVTLKGDLVDEHQLRSFKSTILSRYDPRGVRYGRGSSGIVGEVYRLNDKPVANVSVSIGGVRTTTDGRGRFEVMGLMPGHYEVFVDGTSAGGANVQYGKFLIGAEVKAGEVTELAPVFLPRIREIDWVDIPNPAPQDFVVTHPSIPGMEIRIPKGTILREHSGALVRRIALMPMPLDRAPFPFPANAVVFVAVQPGGMRVEGLDPARTRGIQVIYPNALSAAPGDRSHLFWKYDASNRGWYVYGRGQISADGRQIVPDPGVELFDTIGFMAAPSASNPPSGRDSPPNCPEAQDPSKPPCTKEGTPKPPPSVAGKAIVKKCRGDPVDCATGHFVLSSTDMTLDDVLPVHITRSYRSGDTFSRSFGYGTNNVLSSYLFFPNNNPDNTLTQLVMADGSPLQFTRTNPGVTADPRFEYFGPNPEYKKATIRQLRRPETGTNQFRWLLVKRDGTQMEFAADLGGYFLTRMMDRFGNVVQFVVVNGRVVRVVSPSGRYIDLTYDGAGRITQVEDIAGRVITYNYTTACTANGSPEGFLCRVTDFDGHTEEYRYAPNVVGNPELGKLVEIKDKRGNVIVTNTYDANSRVLTQALAESGTYQYAWTLDSSTPPKVIEASITNPRIVVEKMSYNADGLLTSRVEAFGTPLARTTSFEYSPTTKLMTAMVDPLSRRTEYGYDAAGNQTLVRRMAGTPNPVVDQWTYSTDFSEVLTYTDARNKVWTNTYDGRGLLTKAKTPLNHETNFEYNGAGLVTKITDPNNKITTFSYVLNDLASTTDPLGRTTQFFTDVLGRVTAVTNPLGHRWTTTYDKSYRVLSRANPMGQTVSQTYDASGNLRTFTDPRGGVTEWTYDRRNRVATRKDPLLKTETYGYDLHDNLTSVLDRKGQSTTHAYDVLDRRTSSTWPVAAPGATTAYTYDAADRLTQIADATPGRTLTRQYDNRFDTLTQEVAPLGASTTSTLNVTYDAAGRRTQMQVVGQTAVTYGYDDSNRLTSITQGTNAVTIAYDPGNRRTELTMPNNTKLVYGWDDGSQLTSLTYRQASPDALLGNVTYTYDLAGRRIAMGGSYARVGLPPALASATYDANNRLTNWAGTTLSYDDNGNLTGDGAFSYTWDSRDRLTGISGAPTSSFAYDPAGRRMTRTVAGTAAGYVYDGWNVVHTHAAGTIISTLLNGLGLDERYSRTNAGGTVAFLTDALGSTLHLRSAGGANTATYTYEPYGAASSSGTDSTAFGYTGREDDGNGLMYYRNRYYHPRFSRFISEDPIGLAGGDNAYRYVDGDPVGGLDPLGLLRVYEIDGFEFHAFLGPPAGGREHARHGEGKSYHIHVRAADGTEVRYSTETWRPLSERDASRETKGHRTIIKDLTEGERKLLDRVTREVFHRGHPNEQQIRGLGRARGVRQAGGRFCPPRGSRE